MGIFIFGQGQMLLKFFFFFNSFFFFFEDLRVGQGRGVQAEQL
jgi:hypothetical protein